MLIFLFLLPLAQGQTTAPCVLNGTLQFQGNVSVCGGNDLCTTLTRLNQSIPRSCRNGTDGANGTSTCPCNAVTSVLVFNFVNGSVQPGSWGPTITYVEDNLAFVAAGFVNGTNAPTNLATTVGLAGGVGIDASLNKLITRNFYVQLDLGQLQSTFLANTVPLLIVVTNQTGVVWQMYASNTTGVRGTFLGNFVQNNTAVPIPGWPSSRYISISTNSTTGGIILEALLFTTCDPGGLSMSSYAVQAGLAASLPYGASPLISDGELAVLTADPTFPYSIWMWQSLSNVPPGPSTIKPTSTSVNDPGRWRRLVITFG